MRVIRGWLFPLVLVSLVLAVAGVAFRAGPIEAGLAGEITARLAETSERWASVSVSGRDITLSGTAPSTDARDIAIGAIRSVWGVSTVHDRSGLIPLADPFEWRVGKSASGVTLTGYVPSDPTRAKVRDATAATNPGAAIRDVTELARGAPEHFDAAAAFALRLIQTFREGSVGLSGNTVTVDGMAADRERFATAEELVRSGVPEGVVLAKADVRPPLAEPFVWSVDYDGATAVLTGNVPDRELAEQLADATAAAIGGKPVDDRTELASGAPDHFTDMVDQSLKLLEHLGSGRVALTGSRLEVNGRARTLDDYDTLTAALAAPAPPGMTIAVHDITPAIVEPYRWQATLAAPGVELNGFMPSSDAQTEVLDAARRLFGAERVVDRTRIADGAPKMDWIGAAKFGLGQLAYLSGGSASVIGQTYSVIGIAATSQSFEAISGELQKTLPASLDLGEARVTPPFASPYRFTAEMSPGGLKLSGVAPDETTRQALRKAAAERFAEQPIADEIELGSGAPDGFAAVATAALQAVSRLEGGMADIADRAVTLRGTAPFAGAAERIKAQLEGTLPEGFVLNANLALSSPQTRVTPAECQTLLGQELAKGGIQFGKGEADIAPESEGLLDRLAALVDRCPEAKIEIGGHTDSGGSTRRNRDLSQARADAVMRYLVDAGIAEERLTAVGYGETKPIASNDTEEGRAQNRRIEFTVQEP